MAPEKTDIGPPSRVLGAPSPGKRAKESGGKIREARAPYLRRPRMKGRETFIKNMAVMHWSTGRKEDKTSIGRSPMCYSLL